MDQNVNTQAINGIIAAGNLLADLTGAEMEILAGKAEAKQAAILRIMKNGPNPLSKESAQPHSASSAEAVVETDSIYREYLDQWSKTVVLKIRAQAAYDAAKLMGQLIATLGGK